MISADAVSHHLDQSYKAPTLNNWFGTDKFGRDVFSRVMYGGRISFTVALLSVVLAVIIGIPYGLLAGYTGGKVDEILSWFINLFMSIPQFLLILTVVALFEPNSISWIVVVIGLLSWMDIARLVRNQTYSIKEQTFIKASVTLGLSKKRILYHHILPNMMPSLIVASALMLGNVILLEAALSFIGLGVQAPIPSWGNIINDGRQVLLDGWWISFFPGMAILITVTCLNLLGEQLQNILDIRTI